jgi:hypothetical protein
VRLPISQSKPRSWPTPPESKLLPLARPSESRMPPPLSAATLLGSGDAAATHVEGSTTCVPGDADRAEAATLTGAQKLDDIVYVAPPPPTPSRTRRAHGVPAGSTTATAIVARPGAPARLLPLVTKEFSSATGLVVPTCTPDPSFLAPLWPPLCAPRRPLASATRPIGRCASRQRKGGTTRALRG